MSRLQLPQTFTNHTLANLELHNFQININMPGNVLLEMFNTYPKLPGVIVSNSQGIVAMISRRIFLEHMSKTYSLELYSLRPVEVYLRMFTTEFLQIFSTCSIEQAAQLALARPASLAYEPIVVIHEDGQLSLLAMHTLLLAQAQTLLAANKLIKQQQQQTQDYLNLLESQKNQLQHSKGKLRESEERYRRLVEFSPETIVVHQAGKINYINLAGAKLFGGKKPEELIGKSISNFICSTRQETLEAQAQRIQKAEELLEPIEDKLLRLDGQIIDVEIVAIPIAYRGEQGVQVLIRDITKRQQAQEAILRAKVAERAKLELEQEIVQRQQVEAALRSSVETNRALLNAIPDLMLRLGRNGILVNFKAAKENSLPIVSSQLLGKHLDEVLPQEVSRPVMDCVETALETKEVQVVEIQLPVDGKLLNYEVRLAVSATDEVMAIVRDITQRKQTEAEIRAALEREKELGELKSRFVAMTSHEFRTPLTTILSSGELLERYSYKWSDEKKLNHLKRIQLAVKQMTGLLNDVLLIGKADAGKLEFNPLALDLVKFCRDLVEEMELASINYKIAFVTQAFCTNSQCVTACMDEKLLRHIFSNLLSNAIKYSPQGSTVDFSFVCQQGCAVFQIKDRGIGIPLADQDKLFDSFHRASNVGTISGTGLGLAIVKKSIDLHGGKIEVNSEVGVGTTFTVSLPLHKQV